MKKNNVQSEHLSNTTFTTSQRLIRHIFEQSPALFYVTGSDGIFQDINAAGVAMLGGVSPEEFIGKISIWSLYENPKDRHRFQELVNEKGAIQEFETRFLRLDKTVLDVRITGSERRRAGGIHAGYEGFIIDITERKKAELALAQSEEKYRTVVESSLTAILVHQDGRIKFANQKFADLTGYDIRSEVLGKNFWDFIHPDHRSLIKEWGLMRERGEFAPEQYFFKYVKKNSQATHWGEIRARHGAYMGKPAVIANFIDVTRSKKAEEEIRQLSRRLVKARDEERKRMAVDLHDQFGQILTAMRFTLDALQKKVMQKTQGTEPCFEMLAHNVEKLADIVRSTTSDVRPDLLDQIVLIPALTSHIAEFRIHQPEIRVDFKAQGLRRRLRAEIELAVYRIVQEALTNIAKHAKATAIDILLTYSHPQIILTIRDNGVGYRFKNKGKGDSHNRKGLGLLTMRERAMSLGGSFEVTSPQGKGTVIRVILVA